MKLALTTILVSLAALGVIAGNLLRPCDCGEGNAPGSCAVSHDQGARDDAGRGCCGGCGEREGEGADEPAEDPEDCVLCCKPAPAGIEAPPSVTLEAHVFQYVWFTCSSSLDDGAETIGLPSIEGDAPPCCPPWRLSEEGLTVFLL